MKNKTIKNLIALSVFAVLFGFAIDASAADLGARPYNPKYVNPYYYTPVFDSNSNNVYSSNNNSNVAYNYGQNQPYNYASQPVSYIEQPTTREIQYIPQNNTQTVRTTNTSSNTQAASVARSTNTVNTNAVTAPKTSGSGQYINFDGYNTLGASAYGVYPNVKYGSNELTALSVRGSGGFMPSSIFQWFLVILLILAIIVIARMVTKTFSKSSHGAPAHH